MPDPANPQSLNRYSYVYNSPIKFVDPTGHMLIEGSGGGGGLPDIIKSPDEDDEEDEDDPICHTYHPCDVDTNLYLLGWENFGQAWSIYWNPNATILQRAGAGYYMGAWGGAHALGVIGIAGVVCGLTPACAGGVESLLGIGGAAQSANIACGGDMCTSETQVVGEKIVTVIGRYPANKNLAESIGGNWLNTSMKVWNSMNPVEQWERNKQWLQEAVVRGDVIRLASKITEAVPGKPFAKALDYLFNQAGYTISTNGQYLYPPGP